MQVKIALRFHFTPVSYHQEHKQERTLIDCWWECKLVQPLWKSVWKVFKKLQLEYRMILLYHSWVYIWKNVSQHTAEISAYLCL
jgi:hypothetical protein